MAKRSSRGGRPAARNKMPRGYYSARGNFYKAQGYDKKRQGTRRAQYKGHMAAMKQLGKTSRGFRSQSAKMFGYAHSDS